MDRTTACYYRSILFNDAESQEALPPSLVILHKFAFKRCQAFGLAIIPKATALQVAMDWMFHTPAGQAFADSHPDLQGLFDEPDMEESADEEEPGVAWDEVAEGTAVVAVDETGSTKEGAFLKRKGGWVHVKHPGVRAPVSYRARSVKLAGV